MSEQPIYQLKVTLQGIRPPIWRRFQVPSHITFYELHQILQVVMGWYNAHLYEFRVKEKIVTDWETLADWGTEGSPGEEAHLDEYVRRTGTTFHYQYDFGDSWEHELVLETIQPPQPDAVYPRCLQGERACPPEDCGGVWGYANLLAAWKDSNHSDHRESQEWLGSEFDPEAFDVDGVNQMLQEGVYWHDELVAASLASSRTFTGPAQAFWDALAEHIQAALLGKVWCGQCGGTTTMVDFKGHIEQGDLILRGRCARCGGPVATLVEGE
jgi:hypothetical protein